MSDETSGKDTPNTSKYGGPISKGDGKLSNEIYDAEYGKYQPMSIPAPDAAMPTALDPSPFTIKGS